MSHPLDMPAFGALTSRHREFAETEGGAMRYDPGIVPFAVTDPKDAAALARLVKPGEVAVVMQKDRVETPPGFVDDLRAPAVQMTCELSATMPDDPRILSLGRADADEMLALATATRPGPFTRRALDLGPFWGIRDEGKLVAMAGIRMSMPGWTEVSGVCAAPEARGKGYARLVSQRAMAEVAARGDNAFLQAWSSNAVAIGLYELMGFRHRAELQVVMLERVTGPDA